MRPVSAATGELVERVAAPDRPFVVAHRGGSLSWPEHTLAAYEHAVRFDVDAVEVSTWRTLDGVWVCTHDDDLSRTTGESVVVSQSTWADLQRLRISPPSDGDAEQAVRPQPMCRLTDVLDRYHDSHVLFVDNKPADHVDEFLGILGGYPDAGRTFVSKSYWRAQSMAEAAHDAGIATWGFHYGKELVAADPGSAAWDLLGMNHDAGDDAWRRIREPGKPVLGHIIATRDQAATALGMGAQGLMVAAVHKVAEPLG